MPHIFEYMLVEQSFAEFEWSAHYDRKRIFAVTVKKQISAICRCFMEASLLTLQKHCLEGCSFIFRRL